jgi:hypothetical protein
MKTSTRGTWREVKHDGASALSRRYKLPGSKYLDQSPRRVCHAFQLLLCVMLLNRVWHDNPFSVK